jgi:hypothetical protein
VVDGATKTGLGTWVGGCKRLWRARTLGATRPEEVVAVPVGGAPGFNAKLGRTAATGREEATGRTDTATVLGGGSLPKKLKEFIWGGVGEEMEKEWRWEFHFC